MNSRNNSPAPNARRESNASAPILGRLAFITRTQSSDQLWTLVALAGIALLAFRRWSLLGPYPPGLDGAQWLALGRGFRGVGRSTEGAYAPLVPLLTGVADSMIGPLPSIRLMAAASGLVLCLAVWIVARDILGPFWGLLTTALIIPASALTEPILYGGYPQTVALAAGIIALWAVVRFLSSGDRGRLFLSAAGALVGAASHHIYFPLLLLSIAVAATLWLTDPDSKQHIPRLGWLVIVLTPSVMLSIGVAYRFVEAGYAAPLDASARSLTDAWEYAARESPLLWLLVVGCGVAVLVARWRNRADAGWLIAAGLFVPAGVVFLVSGQPRLLPPLLVGTGLAIGLGASNIARRGTLPRASVVLALVLIAATLALPADRAARQFAEFYAVVDDPLVRAADAIAVDGGSGAIVVRQDRRGWPIGWWFEALLDRRVLVGSDPRWLAFPQEVDHAQQAAAIFDGALDAETFLTRANAAEAQYLVTLKWDWIGWERWTSAAAFPVTVIYDDDRYLVLRVS